MQGFNRIWLLCFVLIVFLALPSLPLMAQDGRYQLLDEIHNPDSTLLDSVGSEMAFSGNPDIGPPRCALIKPECSPCPFRYPCKAFSFEKPT